MTVRARTGGTMSIACTMGRSRAASRTGSETPDETLIQSIAAGDRQAMKISRNEIAIGECWISDSFAAPRSKAN